MDVFCVGTLKTMKLSTKYIFSTRLMRFSPTEFLFYNWPLINPGFFFFSLSSLGEDLVLLQKKSQWLVVTTHPDPQV